LAQTNRVEQYCDTQTQSFRQRSQEVERSRIMVNKRVKPLLETVIAKEEATNRTKIRE